MENKKHFAKKDILNTTSALFYNSSYKTDHEMKMKWSDNRLYFRGEVGTTNSPLTLPL